MAIDIAEAKRIAALKSSQKEGHDDSLDDIYSKRALKSNSSQTQGREPRVRPNQSPAPANPQTDKPRVARPRPGSDVKPVAKSVNDGQSVSKPASVENTGPSKPIVVEQSHSKPIQEQSRKSETATIDNTPKSVYVSEPVTQPTNKEPSQVKVTKGSEGVSLENSSGVAYNDKPDSSVKLVQVKLPEEFVKTLRELVPSATSNNDAVISYLALLLSNTTPLSDRQAALYADLKERDDLRQNNSFKSIESQIESLDANISKFRSDTKDRDMMALSLLGEMMLNSLGFSQSSFPKTPSDFSVDNYRSDNISDILRIMFKDVVKPHRSVIEDYKNPRLRN